MAEAAFGVLEAMLQRIGKLGQDVLDLAEKRGDMTPEQRRRTQYHFLSGVDKARGAMRGQYARGGRDG